MPKKIKKTKKSNSVQDTLYVNGPRGKYMSVTDDNFNALASIPEVSAYWKEILDASEDIETLMSIAKWATNNGCAGVYAGGEYWHFDDECEEML